MPEQGHDGGRAYPESAVGLTQHQAVGKPVSFGLRDELPKRRTLERSESNPAVPVRPHRHAHGEMAEAAVAVVEEADRAQDVRTWAMRWRVSSTSPWFSIPMVTASTRSFPNT